MPDHPVSVPKETPFATVEQSALFTKLIGGAATPETLKQMLESKHPEYEALRATWQRNADIGLALVYDAAGKRRYLVQGENEGDSCFDKRIELSAFSPETPELLNDFAGSVFGEAATRDVDNENLKGSDEQKTRMQKFIDMAGLREEPLEAVSRRALRLALVYNEVDGVLDHPAGEDTPIPYVTLYTPDNRFNWETDAQERFIWVKYHERTTEQDTWDGKRRTIDEYRIITRPEPTVLERDGVGKTGETITIRIITESGKAEVIEGPEIVPHQFHDIPVRTLWWDREGNTWAQGPIEQDIKAFRQESDHDYDVFNVAHPTVLAALHVNPKTGERRTFGSLERGSDKVIHIDPGDGETQPEDVRYLEVDSSPLEHQANQAEKTRERVKKLAGTGTEQVGVARGAQPQSGVAMEIDRLQREKNYRTASQALGEWEWQLLELVLLEGRSGENIERKDVIQLQYPNSFDLRRTDELAQDLQDAQAIGSETLIKRVKKAMVSKLIGSGVTAAELDKIHAEIEAAEAVPVDGELQHEEMQNAKR